ncbi:hypothetical protein [Glutamicibacter protophormiae]|uniref:Uncharacterized protein n=1 Tax=Glutamicibacter protophormiae TaxID=37930 RepID=A0ABS4XMG0_GLUPR|nr:hypothetical protein [Glutamicibacter protophormiae]MBP2397696.1 hypothetical protein [Glutamicibacter protophormiae]GGL87241.1 hypothetical protein GCM10010038_16640 [Glutamicibacter protophormiae]
MQNYFSTEHSMNPDHGTPLPVLSFSGTPAEFYLNFGMPIYP